MCLWKRNRSYLDVQSKPQSGRFFYNMSPVSLWLWCTVWYFTSNSGYVFEITSTHTIMTQYVVIETQLHEQLIVRFIKRHRIARATERFPTSEHSGTRAFVIIIFGKLNDGIVQTLGTLGRTMTSCMHTKRRKTTVMVSPCGVGYSQSIAYLTGLR